MRNRKRSAFSLPLSRVYACVMAFIVPLARLFVDYKTTLKNGTVRDGGLGGAYDVMKAHTSIQATYFNNIPPSCLHFSSSTARPLL